MLGRDLSRALDPVLFARDVGLEPDGWQGEVLAGGHRRMLLNCARQTGKSTTTAALAAWTALYQPPALVLIVSPAERQSGETFRKAMAFYRALGAGAPELELESVLRAQWRNGSRLIALPGSGDTIRSYSAVDLLILDEASRIPDTLLAAVRPMLAVSRGRLVALSTPAGRRGFFFEAWEHGQDWHKVKFTAENCPRITAEFLEHERREIGELLYRQEYLCEFVDDGESVFMSKIIEAALSDDVAPLFAV